MTSFLDDKCDEIRSWLAIGDDIYTNAVVTGWIRMAEEQLSTALRVKHMVQIDTCAVTTGRVPLPQDWQEIRLVRELTSGGVLRYNTPDDFFNPEWDLAPSTDIPGQVKRYTILGNFIVLSRSSDGTPVELTYYQNIPPLTNDANSWINQYHPSVFIVKILHIASLYAIEDERGPIWDQQVKTLVNSMNLSHSVDRASGSVLTPVRKKTFG